MEFQKENLPGQRPEKATASKADVFMVAVVRREDFDFLSVPAVFCVDNNRVHN